MQNKETSPRLDLETLKTPDIALSSSEQKAILFGLTSFLLNHTHLEVSGDLTPASLEEIKELREVYCKFSDALGQSEKLAPEEWLYLGIFNRVPREQLEKLADESDVLIQSKARYFLQKQEKTE